MGLDILKKKARDLFKSDNPTQLAKAGWFSNSIQCIESFLLIIAKNPALIAQFRTFLFGLKVLAEAQVTAIELFVVQLETINATANALINQVRGIATQTSSQLSPFNFKAFETCPFIRELRDRATKLKAPSSGFKKLKNKLPTLAWLKRKEQEVRMRDGHIRFLRKRVDELKVLVKVWDAVLDTIDKQFFP